MVVYWLVKKVSMYFVSKVYFDFLTELTPE